MSKHMQKPELLSPAGSLNKMYTAFHFGADAVYFGGKNFSLRAFSQGFDSDELRQATAFCKKHNKKLYATLNVYPKTAEFGAIEEYLSQLQQADVDAVIVSDLGVLSLVLKKFPELPVHISTQANTLNAEAVKFYKSLGVARVILARELSLDNIKEIKDAVSDMQLECFVHGAMCVSYSGRCVLSNYIAKRDANMGQCAQPCRWRFALRPKGADERLGQASEPHKALLQKGELEVREDERGTYVFNSLDLNMIRYVKELQKSGVDSFKIEGRMKTAYYVGSVTNAYRRAIDGSCDIECLENEMKKVGNRGYGTGLFFSDEPSINLNTSKNVGESVFAAEVVGYDEQKKAAVVEQRNRFKKGDVLEVLSPDDNFLQKIKVEKMYDQNGLLVDDAKNVQQKLWIETDIRLNKRDILRG